MSPFLIGSYLTAIFFYNQLVLTKFGVCDIRKMTSIVQGNHWKRDRNRGAPGTRLRCLGRVVKNGGITFPVFRKEEVSELLPKNMARTHLDG